MKLLPFERRFLGAMFATVLPRGATLQATADDAQVGAYIDELMAASPWHFAAGLRACVWFVLLAPPFAMGRLCSFMGLALDEREQLFERLSESDVHLVRELPMLFKTAACLGLCGLPELQANVGISPVDPIAPGWARRSLPTLQGQGAKP